MKQIIIIYIFILSFFSFNFADDKSTSQNTTQYMSAKVNGVMMKSNLVTARFTKISKNDYGFIIISPLNKSGAMAITIQNPKNGANGFSGACKDFTGCALLTYSDGNGTYISGKHKSSYSVIDIIFYKNKSNVNCCKGTFSGKLVKEGSGNGILTITDGEFDFIVKTTLPNGGGKSL